MPDLSKLIPAGARHPRVKQYLALKHNLHANHENLACIEGIRMLKLALQARLEIYSLFVCPDLLRSEQTQTLARTAMACSELSLQISAKVLEGLTEWDGPDGLVALVRLPRMGWQNLALREQNLVLVLDGLQIPGNIGTIIRCAEGAGADAIVLCSKKQRLTHPKIVRASMGALFSFPVIEAQGTEAIIWLKQQRFRLITTDTDATKSYRQIDYRGRVAIVMGNEHSGISPEWYAAQDESVMIPMNGRADSLNVGNAAVLMLYEALHQQQRLPCSG
jgi:TrmH family RNA methyltransferase